MEEIKLRKINSKKYCHQCKDIMEIKMDRLVGRCPVCKSVLYTIDNRKKEDGKKRFI